MDSLRTAQKMHEIEQHIGRLSKIQKVLLTTDGSITQILEMVTGNPIEIRTLIQEIIPADTVLADALSIGVGDDVNYRIVELRDSTTGEVLIHAVSHTPIKRLDPAFKEDLMRADIPIGRIIRKHQIESRREILDAGATGADEQFSRRFGIYRDEPLLHRNYRIIHRNMPLIAIKETFPYNKFLDEQRVIVNAPSRLHLALIDLNGSLGRVDGGIGLTLKDPSLLIEARHHDKIVVHGGDNDTQRRVHDAAETILSNLGISSGVEISLRQNIRQHLGLGSGTQLVLATASAVARLNGRDLAVSQIARMVGRGGTSGIGTAAFSTGGFIVDGGHSFGASGDKQDFRPSSASAGIRPAPVISRLPFPEDWSVILVLPDIPGGASGSRERDLFSTHCPVPLEEVREICHEILMRMLPGIVEHDLDLFGSAVNRMQEIGFKRIEHSLQPPIIASLLDAMRRAGAPGAGMSSFGPAIFAVGDNGLSDIKQAAREVLGENGGEILITSAQNIGARIRTA